MKALFMALLLAASVTACTRSGDDAATSEPAATPDAAMEMGDQSGDEMLDGDTPMEEETTEEETTEEGM